MIHYQLTCSRAHAFDGWFKDSAGFELQCEAGLVACPECGDASVSRALMAPSIARRRAAATAGPADQVPVPQLRSEAPAQLPGVSGAGMPDQVRSMLQRLRAEVEAKCEDVGDRFAEEARAIHNGGPPRGIYGHTTVEQAEALADEGIEVARIPWVPRADG